MSFWSVLALVVFSTCTLRCSSDSIVSKELQIGVDIVAATDWMDTNQVLVDGKWYKVPMDKIYGEGPQPPLPYDDKHLRNDSTIIVLIASFRETRCKDTLFNFFSKAQNAKRVRIGVVQQNAKHDPDCFHEYCKMMNPSYDASSQDSISRTCPFSENIRMLRLLQSEAKGPVYARALGNSLVKDEDFCLQIDAHTDVANDWDQHLLHEWASARNEFAVLSTYPSNIKDIGQNSNNHWEMPHLCAAQFAGKGAVRNSRAKAAANLERPILAPLWAAGLSFSKCHAELLVPNDIELKHVFNGEEFSRGARLWTHGYDFYTVTRAYLGTFYQQEKGGLGTWHSNHAELKRSNERMATLLQFADSDQSTEAKEKLGFFALGKKRSLDQYIEFTGIDTRNRKANWQNKCVRKWVAFDDSEERRLFETQGDFLPQLIRGRVKPRALVSSEATVVALKAESPVRHFIPAVSSESKFDADSVKLVFWLLSIFVCVVAVIGAVAFRRKQLNRWFRQTRKRQQHII